MAAFLSTQRPGLESKGHEQGEDDESYQQGRDLPEQGMATPNNESYLGAVTRADSVGSFRVIVLRRWLSEDQYPTTLDLRAVALRLLDLR